MIIECVFKRQICGLCGSGGGGGYSPGEAAAAPAASIGTVFDALWSPVDKYSKKYNTIIILF